MPWGAEGYWNSNRWPFLAFISSLLFLSHVFYSLPPPSFPLTHHLMVIYLAGKGFAFSSERFTTARHGKEREWCKGDDRITRKSRDIKKKNVSFMSVSPVTLTLPPTLPHSCNASKGLATDRKEGEKRIICQYLFPPAAWIETDTLHSFSLFPYSQFKSFTVVWDQGSPGRKQTWWNSEQSDRGKVRV